MTFTYCPKSPSIFAVIYMHAAGSQESNMNQSLFPLPHCVYSDTQSACSRISLPVQLDMYMSSAGYDMILLHWDSLTYSLLIDVLCNPTSRKRVRGVRGNSAHIKRPWTQGQSGIKSVASSSGSPIFSTQDRGQKWEIWSAEFSDSLRVTAGEETMFAVRGAWSTRVQCRLPLPHKNRLQFIMSQIVWRWTFFLPNVWVPWQKKNASCVPPVGWKLTARSLNPSWTAVRNWCEIFTKTTHSEHWK